MLAIQNIRPLSLAKMQGLIMALFGLVAGVFTGLVASFLPVIAQPQAAMFGWWALLILPMFYGSMGFIGGGIFALIYNMFAKKFKGIELDIIPIKK